jgi:hypothetical protein
LLENSRRIKKGVSMFSSWRDFPLFRSLQSQSRRAQAGKLRRSDRKVQLRVESLENRLVPSASSAISVLHATGQNQTTTEHDWYTVDQSTLQVVEFKETTRHNLPGGPNAFSLSASIGPAGSAECFALQNVALDNSTAHGPLWLADELGNWHNFGGDYYGISATHDGHVYAIGTSGNVFYLNSNGTGANLGAPAVGVKLTAAPAAGRFHFFLSSHSYNEVFVIGANNAIYVNSSPNANSWQLVDRSASFADLSASGLNTAFAVTSAGKLYQETEHWSFNGMWWVGSWSHKDISSGRTYTTQLQISADVDAPGRPEVYAVEVGTFNLYLYDQGSLTQKDSWVVDVAAADGGYFYDTNPSGSTDSAWQYNPKTPWHWTFLGNGLR